MALGSTTIRLNKSGFCVLCIILVVLLLYSLSSINSSKEINLGILLKVAIKAAENGGYKVVQFKDNLNVRSKGLTKEGLVDSVTTADLASHCAMSKTIKQFFPSINIVSEEAKTVCENDPSINLKLKTLLSDEFPDEFVKEEDVTVWIDPLDATYEYTAKLYQFVTTMVCVAVKGKPIIGVIHRPFNTSTSWAWVDRVKSVDLNTVSKKILKDDTKVIISMSHRGKIEQILEENLSQKIQIITAAGAGYKALEVATGKVDAYLHITAIKKWDICAGNAIINALGGKMTTKFNKDVDYSADSAVQFDDGIIASIKKHQMFVEIF